MNNKKLNNFMIIMGLLLIGYGLFLVKILANPQGIMLALPYSRS